MATRRGNNGPDTLNFRALGDSDDRGFGFGGNDTLLGGRGDDLLRGGLGNDKLFGDAGDDSLFGDAGNDFLSGGAGDDELYGGLGKDKFEFKVGSGRDIVYDFKDNVDTLYIDRDYGFTSVRQLLEHASSSGGDSAIDLSKNGDDSPRIILLGLDNFNKLADDIVLI